VKIQHWRRGWDLPCGKVYRLVEVDEGNCWSREVGLTDQNTWYADAGKKFVFLKDPFDPK